MNIAVFHDHFSTLDEAQKEIAEHQLYPIEMAVPPVDNQSHWHDFSTRIYILDGELQITDISTGNTLRASAGSLVEVPERVLHTEFSVSGYRIIAGMTVDPSGLTGPVDLDPDLLS
jgi:hypothetical protein